MIITPIGFLLIPVGVILFLFSKRNLLKFTIITICFSGTIIGGIPEKTFSVSLFTFLSLLWIFRETLDYLLNTQKTYPKKIQRSNFLLLLFGLFIFFSTINAFFYEGLEYKTPGADGFFIVNRLNFSIWHIINSWIMLQNILFSILLANRVLREPNLNILKYYIQSISIILLFGFIELANYYFNLGLPLFLMNNIFVGDDAGSFTSRLSGLLDLLRLSSLAEEPSFFALHLLIGLSFLLIVKQKGHLGLYSFEKNYSLLLFSIVLAILLTLSSTGYFGLIIIILLQLFLSQRFKFLLRMITPYIVLFLLLNLFATLYLPGFKEFRNLAFDEFIVSKFVSGSFNVRFQTVIEGLNVFSQAPLFGVGWGVINPNDLLVKILVGSGILGLLIFLSFLISITKDTIQSKKLSIQLKYQKTNSKDIDGSIYLYVIFFILIISQLSGFHYRLGELFMFIGLLFAHNQFTMKKNL